MPAKRSTVKNTATVEWTPPGLSGDEIRARFVAYFTERGHLAVPSSSLIPRNDPTVLLTTAGMQQMIPYFLGQQPPPSRQMTSVQKCFRTTDIDSVGDTSHLTFFEMLGNFSVGTYFKREAIQYAWTLLTEDYGLPAELLYPTVHPDDAESPGYWHEVTGIPAESLTRLADNWWGPPGASGPCGPDSEIYFDRGVERGCGNAGCAPGCERCDPTWRSGTWSSCSTFRTSTGRAHRSSSPTSTPAWGWSGWRRCCRAASQSTTPISSVQSSTSSPHSSGRSMAGTPSTTSRCV